MGETLNRTSALLATAGLLVLGGVTQAALLSLDFQGDAAGSPPAGYDLHYPAPGNADNYAIVVDGASTPADPFGGAGNKSLLVQDNLNNNDTYIGWDYNDAAAADIVNGTLKFKIFLSSSGSFTTPYTNVRIGQNGAGSGSDSAILVYFSFPSGSYLNKLTVETPGGPQILDNALNFNTAYDVEFNFNSTTHTFSGKLNGATLTQGATTSWSYAMTGINAVDSVTFNAGTDSLTGDRVFVDNVELVPEPSAFGLAGLGLLGMARRRRS